MGYYFVDIDLGVGDSMTERPPPMKKKKELEEMVYKTPVLEIFFGNLSSTHFVEEIHELKVVVVEFLDLGMVKIELEYSIPGLDNLLAWLEERCLSNWDILASPE